MNDSGATNDSKYLMRVQANLILSTTNISKWTKIIVQPLVLSIFMYVAIQQYKKFYIVITILTIISSISHYFISRTLNNSQLPYSGIRLWISIPAIVMILNVATLSICDIKLFPWNDLKSAGCGVSVLWWSWLSPAAVFVTTV